MRKFWNGSLSVSGGRGAEGEILADKSVKKFKSFVNSPLTNNINLVGRPTKIKWKIHALFRQRVVDLSCTSKNKVLIWFCRINFDYYEKFCSKMFFSFFFQVYKKGKIHTKLNHASKFTLMPNYSLVMYFMIWFFVLFSHSFFFNIRKYTH